MSKSITDEAATEIAQEHLNAHQVKHGKLWEVVRYSGRISVWFWRFDATFPHNVRCTMTEDGRVLGYAD